MAMLAEPRRRQKWTLNPRGKHWSEDSNKFGQKMLEKMGWSSGKGLGANEQGMTDHVRVSFKNDNAGFGFKNDGKDKAWTEHQDGFNDFLKELQDNQEDSETKIVETKHETLSGKSLELKSKQSRARVHYQKFTRGKDVNKYSSKDLANIFGQKDLSTINTPKEDKVVEVDEEYCPDPVGTEDTRGGVLTIKSGSISDYLKNKGSGLYKANETTKRERQTDSEDEPAYAGFGFSSSQKDESNNHTIGMCNYGFVNPCLKLDSPEETASPVVKTKKSKKRKSASTFYDEELDDSIKKPTENVAPSNDCMNGFANPALNLGNEEEETRNGNEFEVSRAEFGLTNTAFDPEDEKGNKKRVTFNDHVEYSTDPVKKKKGKATLDKFEVEVKKHKRKRKHEESGNDSAQTGFVNEALETLDCEDKTNEILDNEINERKTKKAKKRRASLLETIVETPEEEKPEIIELDTNGSHNGDVIEIENESMEKDAKKKKKKKKKDKVKDQDIPKEDSTNKVEEEHVDHTPKKKKKDVITIETEQQISEKSAGESKKKKKQKHTTNIEDSVPTIDEHVNQSEAISEHSNKKDESSTRKKKDKKLKRDVDKCEVIIIDDSSKNEKEVSDKENTRTEKDDKVKSKKKSKKDRTKSVDKASEINTCHVDEPKEKAEDEEKAQETVDSSSANNSTEAKVTRSPWNQRARMSKKLLQSLFHRNAISNFPGSNIYDIEGYGANLA